jgi:hypothetical protein
MNVIPLVQEKDSIRRTHLIQNQPAKSLGTMSVPSVFTSDVNKAVQCHQQFTVGEPVEAQYGASIIARNPTVSKEDYCKARNYSAATVFELNLDGTLHLHYSDGSSENHVYPVFVRPASKQARVVLATPKGRAGHRQAECAYEAFLQSHDTAHEEALKSHSQAIAKKNVLMETVQKDLDTKLAKALRFPEAQEAVRKQVYAKFAEQIRSAEDAVAASQQLVTDTGRMCGAITVALASLPLIYPLTGEVPGIPTTLPIVEPLD